MKNIIGFQIIWFNMPVHFMLFHWKMSPCISSKVSCCWVRKFFVFSILYEIFQMKVDQVCLFVCFIQLDRNSCSVDTILLCVALLNQVLGWKWDPVILNVNYTYGWDLLRIWIPPICRLNLLLKYNFQKNLLS